MAGLPAGLWARQPRITAKSGWITGGAAQRPETRARFQAAACEMGLVVMAAKLPLMAAEVEEVDEN